MAKLLGRSPTEQDEHAYYQWAKKYLWNDRRCDRCDVLLPEDDVHVHDVWEDGRKLPKRVYCSEACYAIDRAPQRVVRGGLE